MEKDKKGGRSIPEEAIAIVKDIDFIAKTCVETGLELTVSIFSMLKDMAENAYFNICDPQHPLGNKLNSFLQRINLKK